MRLRGQFLQRFHKCGVMPRAHAISIAVEGSGHVVFQKKMKKSRQLPAHRVAQPLPAGGSVHGNGPMDWGAVQDVKFVGDVAGQRRTDEQALWFVVERNGESPEWSQIDDGSMLGMTRLHVIDAK